MSEPIELYDIDANIVIMHAPTTAAILVEQGVLFECPPTIIPEDVKKVSSPPAKGAKVKKE